MVRSTSARGFSYSYGGSAIHLYPDGYGYLTPSRERSMHETPANLYVNGARHKQREEPRGMLPGGLLEDT